MNPFDLPLFIPVVLAVTIVAVVTARPVSRSLHTGPVVAGLLVAAVGVVLAATITPQATAFEGATGAARCDLAMLRPADPDAYLQFGEILGNTLLLLPLGVLLGLLPPSRARAALVAAAVVLPFLVEGVQLLVPSLDRACQGADVVENLLGLGVGLGLGWGMARVARRARRDSAGPETPG